MDAQKNSNDGWSNLHFKILFLSSAVIFQIIFFQIFFRNTIRVSSSLDPGRARHFRPGLDRNCFAKFISRQQILDKIVF